LDFDTDFCLRCFFADDNILCNAGARDKRSGVKKQENILFLVSGFWFLDGSLTIYDFLTIL
jgi:hypothetical protein